MITKRNKSMGTTPKDQHCSMEPGELPRRRAKLNNRSHRVESKSKTNAFPPRIPTPSLKPENIHLPDLILQLVLVELDAVLRGERANLPGAEACGHCPPRPGWQLQDGAGELRFSGNNATRPRAGSFRDS